MAGSIPKEFIRDIIDMTDIVSLIDSYLPLKRRGSNHWGQCPFCDDGNNPSFSVSEQKQFYFCFKFLNIIRNYDSFWYINPLDIKSLFDCI